MKSRHIALLIIVVIAVIAAYSCSGGKEAPDKKPVKENVAQKAKSAKTSEVWLKLSEADKQYLMGVGRKAFDLYVTKREKYRPTDIPENLKTMKGNRAFATIYKKGDWRGCVSAMGDNVVDTAIKAVINTCNDKRFKNPAPDEVKDFRVELSFLQPMELIESKDPSVIKKELEPGVHGIQIRHTNGKRAFFLPYVFVKKQRSTITWLERICRKAGLRQDAWKDPATKIYRYGTINFIESKPYGKSVDLYRYKVELDDIPNDGVANGIALTKNWLLQHKKGIKEPFKAGYNKDHKPLAKASITDQLSAILALGYLADQKKDVELSKEVRWAYDQLKDNIVTTDDGEIFIKEGEKELLEETLILADLAGSTGALKNRKALVKGVAKSIRKLTSGKAAIPAKGKIISDLPNYAVFVAAQLAKNTDDAIDVKHAKVLLDTQFKEGGIWAAAALIEASLLLKDSKLAERALAEAKKLVATQYTLKSAPYADFTGAFTGDNTPTTVSVSERIRNLAKVAGAMGAPLETDRKALERSILFATRWLLEQQFTEQSAFYIKGYEKMLGAFKQDILVNTTHLADVAAGLTALVDVQAALGDRMPDALADIRESLQK